MSEEQLPPGWSATPLGEIAAINPPIDRCIIDDDTEVSFVPMRAVAAEGGGLVAPEKRRYREVKKGYTAFRSGDVIMAKITPCTENGKTTVVPDVPGLVCFGSTEFHTIRPEQGVQPEWIEQFLLQHETRRNAQRAMAGGVGQMRVPAEFLKTVRIPVAPTAEQSRIAEALDELFSDLDAGVAALELARDKLKLYRASVLKAAVEGSLTAEWRRRNPQAEPAEELLKRILVERRRRWEKDQINKFREKGKTPPKNWKAKYKEPVAPDTADLPTLPEGWCWATLGRCFKVNVGATPRRSIAEFWNGRIPWVSSGEVQFGSIAETREKITEAGLANSNTRLNPAGSVILNMIGEGRTRGKAGILEVDACNNQNCAAIWVSRTPIAPEYIYYWLIYRYEENRKLGSGNNQPAMNKGIVEGIVVPIPSAAEQRAIVEAVEDQLSTITRLESDIESKLEASQALRQATLKHAFNGKLVPQDPKDEPAPKLLAQITTERKAREEKAASAGRSASSRKARRSRRPRTSKHEEP